MVARLRHGRNLEGPDVIVGSSPHFFAAAAADKLARRLRVPFVLEIRDIWPQSLVEFGGIPESNPMIRWMRRVEPRLYRNAKVIISLLPLVSSYLEKFNAAEKFCYVPNGIDEHFLPEVSEPPAGQTTVLMYSGAHGVANGLSELVAAMALLKNDKVKLVLIGEGPQKSKLIDQARSSGLTNVEFRPAVPKDKVFNVLAEANVFVTLAVDAPVFKWGISPNKVFDYLAMNRPVLFAGRVPESPVEKAGGGLVVDPDATSIANGIRQFVNMKQPERTAMAESGRKYVLANHTFARLAGDFELALIKACESQ